MSIIESWDINDWEIETDAGWEDIKKLHKTKKYKHFLVKTNSNQITVSYDHTFFNENYDPMFLFQLSIGDSIITKNGIESIVSIEALDVFEEMYDFELYEGNRRYFTNDILYITLEMSEDKIAQRFDANFLNVDINDVPDMDESSFKTKIKSLSSKFKGKIVIKEYPPGGSTSPNNIRALLEELRIKKNFTPKFIYVDYLNLLGSDKYKTNDNLYIKNKSVAEELRGIAVEYDIGVITATQANREGNSEKTTDLDFTSTSESKGIPDTSDVFIALIYPKELREQNIQIWKILKNRFGGIVDYKIPFKINYSKVKIIDLKDSGEDAKKIKIYDNDSCNNLKMKKEKSRIKEKSSIIVVDECNLDDADNELMEMIGE